VRRLVLILLFAALAGCASTSASDPNERSVEVHGLFMSGAGVVRR
jgi:hypothetical protein